CAHEHGVFVAIVDLPNVGDIGHETEIQLRARPVVEASQRESSAARLAEPSTTTAVENRGLTAGEAMLATHHTTVHGRTRLAASTKATRSSMVAANFARDR